MAAEKKETAKRSAAKKAPEKKTKQEEKAFDCFKGQVVYGSLNVRKEPKIEAGNIVKVLPVDTEVLVIGADQFGDWLQTEDGWIMAKYVDR